MSKMIQAFVTCIIIMEIFNSVAPFGWVLSIDLLVDRCLSFDVMIISLDRIGKTNDNDVICHFLQDSSEVTAFIQSNQSCQGYQYHDTTSIPRWHHQGCGDPKSKLLGSVQNVKNSQYNVGGVFICWWRLWCHDHQPWCGWENLRQWHHSRQSLRILDFSHIDMEGKTKQDKWLELFLNVFKLMNIFFFRHSS